ncbi:GntR family transcriptional regulator [Barnesiella viscericola]|uniref:GntR family transcriptional regulator n=1 Tax=Barnesiella viscericola TaxID=397865 RepID=UPI0023568E03|nr:GntR family transcriptional regulator [Barnesiella viscericola]
MQFKENQTIYLQIAERISDEILLGHYATGARIPSVREYAALVEVNANTVMRSYEFLQTQGIIFNKRGIGFFVSPDAKIKIREYRRNEFLKNELPRFFMQLYTLHIPMDEIDSMYREFIENLTSNPSNQAS